ncbi:MAG: chemotaxis protein CheW [Deltaproteobacteria bacterium]|nr:chemotaxis protein CheW [Deltaproteobacteria bacterium]
MRFDVAGSQGSGTERKLIGFFVGAVHYGVDIMSVREILRPTTLVPVHSAPPYVAGVADHRESVVPVIDMRLRLGLEPSPDTARTKWILVRTSGKDVGLIVDCVTNVIPVSDADRRERHAVLSSELASWVCGVFGIEGGLLFEIDVDLVVGLGA